ncbi:peptidylprolyl isomerase [Heliophilum fasciatum]|uniref:Peptidyl-prolyl cis-trans isomerase n=1 Tax=Heliophilum fasciatum TaxID=35700 RepID=A0A4R2RZ71_9FIRM|nr:peptidylprolyl isomerase [Heliophilum fasciatum]MCW2276741.1 cyclophilin family peptidyl-prolyl cis-trans isomerase [Heliophilum fasciatum]TCP68878.1 cyclophilin family peptidyl-prolyl cis-trans isomerase [Heliophilum fasciatum]
MKRKAIASLMAAMLTGSILTGCGSSTPNTPAPEAPAPAPAAPKNTPAPNTASPNDTASRNNKYTSAPAMTIDPAKSYTAYVQTNKGNFTIKLLAAEAPTTVNNFVFLARDGFFNGIRFHRIMKNFMIQTGDPLGNGTGGPGYTFKDELPPKIAYAPGVVAMANRGPNTNGSQFFICNGDNARNLNKTPNYTVFGQVTEGMDTVLKISDTPVQAGPTGESSKPTENVIIENITIEEK